MLCPTSPRAFTRPIAVASAILIAVAAMTGCASRPATTASAPTAGEVAAPLATGWSGSGAAWAIVQTGGAAAGRFWQLLVRRAGSSSWSLVTPPGVADNAGLVVTAMPGTAVAGASVTAGFVPGEQLTFSPLSLTSDYGSHWAQAVLPTGIVAAPDALAGLAGGRLLAVTATGVEISAPRAASWTTLITRRALAATSAGRTCGLTSLTGVTATASGAAMVAGLCSHPGEVGLFEQGPAGWRLAGPAVPASLAGRQITVLRLVGSDTGTAVILAARDASSVIGRSGWLASKATTWTEGAAYRLPGGKFASLSASSLAGWGLSAAPTRAIVLGGLSAPGQHAGGGLGALMSVALPAAGATLVLGAGSEPLTALAPGASTIAVWQRTATGSWRKTQVVSVPTFGGPGR